MSTIDMDAPKVLQALTFRFGSDNVVPCRVSVALRQIMFQLVCDVSTLCQCELRIQPPGYLLDHLRMVAPLVPIASRSAEGRPG